MPEVFCKTKVSKHRRLLARGCRRLIAGGLTPIARWGEPADVAGCIRTLATGQMPFCTGEAFHIDGGLHIHTV